VGEGRFFPSLLETRKRAAYALVAVVPEGYVQDLSTRPADNLVRGWGCKEPARARYPGGGQELSQQGSRDPSRQSGIHRAARRVDGKP
jgi:transposase-like protein